MMNTWDSGKHDMWRDARERVRQIYDGERTLAEGEEKLLLIIIRIIQQIRVKFSRIIGNSKYRVYHIL